MRRLGMVLLVGMVIIAQEGCQRSSAPTSSPVSSQAVTPPTCGGGQGASPGTMGSNEMKLANYINSYRYTFNNPGATAAPPNGVNVGVAQWHARDMAGHGESALVASDGEDALRRIVCSGGTAGTMTGVIAVGHSTDPKATFDALQVDPSSARIIADTKLVKSLSIGYSNGYWMIILQ